MTDVTERDATEPRPATGKVTDMMSSDTAARGTVGGMIASSRPGLALPPMRFAAIWIAFVILMVLCALFLPHSVEFGTLMSIVPFAAFLAFAAMGQGVVLMAQGIDLSAPSIVAISCSVLLGVSGGSNDRLVLAIAVVLLTAAAIGAVNGILVAVLKLNALIVTLAIGSVVTGINLWYRQSLAAESKVPQALANFGSERLFGFPTSVWCAVLATALLTVLLRRTVVGRRFEAAGANPRAAYATGVEVMRYQAGAFVLAALLYGVMAILLAGFIRNPTQDVGVPYLLAPIAAAVLGGTSIGGGIGSMIAIAGAALFLVQLEQALKMIGLPTSYQLIIEGGAIAIGMWLSQFQGRR